MLFSEIYGNYFRTMEKVLKEAVQGTLTEQKLQEIVERQGFEESRLHIPKSLKTQTWPLIDETYNTPLHHKPEMALTILEKRWMKALLEDPKMKLFGLSGKGLEDVEPLFRRDTIVYFDQQRGGDPFEDASYIRHFRTILQAFREKRKLRIEFLSTSKGILHRWDCVPHRLEYSLKDDKFRLMTRRKKYVDTINLSTITACSLLELYDAEDENFEIEKKQVVLELTDERNALERIMLHFSHLQKETKRLDRSRYRIRLTYNQQDETEILIRIMSFGPMVKVVEPESFVQLMRERLINQKQL